MIVDSKVIAYVIIILDYYFYIVHGCFFLQQSDIELKLQNGKGKCQGNLTTS